ERLVLQKPPRLRKVGTPDSAEMPAPVSAATRPPRASSSLRRAEMAATAVLPPSLRELMLATRFADCQEPIETALVGAAGRRRVVAHARSRGECEARSRAWRGSKSPRRGGRPAAATG